MAIPFSLDGTHSASGTSVTVNEAVPPTLRGRGYLRLGSGTTYEMVEYASWSGKVFTLVSTLSYSHGDTDQVVSCEPTILDASGEVLISPRTSQTVKHSGQGHHISTQRLPTDPFYYANVEVNNIAVGSRWALGYYTNNDPIDGTWVQITNGTSVATSFVISNVAAYGSPFLLALRVRKSSASPKYIPQPFYTFHSSGGATIYVSQVPDEVA